MPSQLFVTETNASALGHWFWEQINNKKKKPPSQLLQENWGFQRINYVKNAISMAMTIASIPVANNVWSDMPYKILIAAVNSTTVILAVCNWMHC